MTLALRSSWCSVKSAMRLSTSSRKPPSWPARTMLTASSLKALGCCGHGVGEAGAVGDLGADLAENLRRGPAGRLAVRECRGCAAAARRSAAGRPAASRRSPCAAALHPLAALAALAAAALGRGDAAPGTARGVEHRHALRARCWRSACPGCAGPVLASGFVGEFGHSLHPPADCGLSRCQRLSAWREQHSCRELHGLSQ